MTQPGYNYAKWRMLIATVFCYMFYYTGRQTFGFAIPSLEEEFGFSKTVLGYFGTTLLWAYAIGQLVNGNLGDKFGGRIMVSLGAILSCGFNWIVSLGTGFFSLFIPWLGNGLAQSMGWAPGSRVLSNWFSSKERGIAFGFFTMAGGMSSIIAFVTSLIIVQELKLDWRWIFRLPVLLLLLGGVAYYIFVRNRPEDLGFKPPEDAADQDESAIAISGETSANRYKAVLKNKAFMASSLGMGFLSAARYALIIWVPVHFLGADWKDSQSAWISTALPVGMAMGALAGGWISDKVFNSVRWKHICLFTVLGAVFAMVMFFLPRGAAAGVVILFLCGFFVYGSQSSFWALCPDLLGKKRSGTGVGVMDFFAYLFAGIAAPLCGWLLGAYQLCDPLTGLFVDNTALVFPFVAISSMISAMIVFFIKR
jgi:MFS transporter, OPA family, glycerol-3-phosphate transporter